MKKIIILLIVIVVFIIFFIVSQKRELFSDIEPISQEPTSLCFYNETLTQSGLHDRSWLRLNFAEEKVSGEYHNVPAEKDSKFGNFQGIYSKDELGVMSRADVLWEAEAEGTIVSEQLLINFTETEALVAFGEMKLGENNTYVYSDPENISYWQTLPYLPCADLDERMLVEKYIRENIKTLIAEEAVLGGNWYVVSLVIDPVENIAMVTSEDGHIQNISTFSYEVENGVVTLLKI